MTDTDDFDAKAAAVAILRTAASGALATLDASGAPFASHVAVATTHIGEPILLLSDLAVHTKNLKRDPRVSLLLVDERHQASDTAATGRLTLTGTMGAPDDDPILARRFLARHGEAAGYAGFRDFAFRRLAVERGHLVAGFGRIVGLAPDELLIDAGFDHDDLITEEAPLLDWLNFELAGLAGKAIAARLDGTTGWRATGLDPEGVDLVHGRATARLAFERMVTTGAEARHALEELLV